ncbi:hypothetical protein [Streptomyces niveus]|uniref:hypothetical protein n=1 Tax=Streptomyces niveus TaxID=193462 RepID=UPI0034334F00
MSMTVEAPVTRNARDLLNAPGFAGVVATVLDNNAGMKQETAEAITEEALKFVAACARFPEARLRPSRVVDEGWHALVLHTQLYTHLGANLGRYVHHRPERPDPTRHDPQALERTQAFIVKAGYAPVPELWLRMEDSGITVSASCTHSPPGPEGSCTGSGEGDGPSGDN